MTAIIAGATGLTGSHVLKLLLEDARITAVIAVGRRTTGQRSEKLKEVIVGDLSELSQNAKNLAGDIYFCCLGTTIKEAGSKDNFAKIDYSAVIDFGRIAKQNHAKAFAVVSASGASASSPVFYSQIKGEAENILKKFGLERLIIFQPALLMGERIKKRAGEHFFMNVFSVLGPLLPAAIKKRLMTSVDHLARRMIDEALSDKPLAVQTFAAFEI